MTWTLLNRLIFRHWRMRPIETAALVLIVAMGVSVYLSVRLANRAAISSFENFAQVITGQSDWVLMPVADTLSDSVLLEIREHLGDRPVDVVPVVETSGSPPTDGPDNSWDTEVYQIVGLDLLGIQNLVEVRPGNGDNDATYAQILDSPNAVFISPELARRKNLKIDDRFKIVITDRVVELEIIGILPVYDDQPEPAPYLLLMDLPGCQVAASKEGKLDRIEVRVADGPNVDQRRTEVGDRLREIAKGRWTVEWPAQHRATGEIMTRAFRLNLLFVSLIALMVGVYLVGQALDGAVLRRRGEIGTLRSMGVEASMIRRLWTLEALFIGIVGSVLGIILGWAGAQGAVRAIGKTIQALYYDTSVESAMLYPSEVIIGIIVGTVACLIAGWYPALLAGRVQPVQLLAKGSAGAASHGPSMPLRIAMGLGLIAIGTCGWFMKPIVLDETTRIPVGGYMAMVLWTVGCGIAVPCCMPTIAKCLNVIGERSVEFRLAVSRLRQPSSRHRMIVGGLLLALGMANGMAIMITSFESTMRGWLQQSLLGDLFIVSHGTQGTPTQNRIPARTWQGIMNDDVTADAEIMQVFSVRLEGLPTRLLGGDLDLAQARMHQGWVVKPDTLIASETAKIEPYPALASESFTERFDLRQGDTVEVPTSEGTKRVIIQGVFAEYGNERGSLMIHRDLTTKWFASSTVLNMQVFLKSGHDAEAVRNDWMTKYPGLDIRTNQGLRERIMRTFDQTFSITYALHLIGVVVAVMGLVLGLSSLMMERTLDLTIQRALGMSNHQIAKATSFEALLITATGVIGGTPLSVALGALLIFVINKVCFGWTLQFVIPWGDIALLTVLVTIAGCLAAYAVGRWGAKLPADQEE